MNFIGYSFLPMNFSPLSFSPEGEMQVTLIRVFILDQCPSP